MRVGFLPSGRKVVVPEDDLEEELVVALMAALCEDPRDGEHLLRDAVYDADGLFRVYGPDRFYWLEQLDGKPFALIAADD
jgi:hypothetical protein